MDKYKIKKRKKEIEEFYWDCPYCDKEIAHEKIKSVYFNIDVHMKNKHLKEYRK